jgi:prepilin-type N-terminal cleavage/methylation domain-containing protein
MKLKIKQNAFSLIELMTVVAIIGIGSFFLSSNTTDNTKLESKNTSSLIYNYLLERKHIAFTEGEDLNITINDTNITSEDEDGNIESSLPLDEKFNYEVNEFNPEDGSKTNLSLPAKFQVEMDNSFDKNIEIIILDDNNSLQKLELYDLTGFINRSHINFQNTDWIEE